jgi:hypothetical protein
MSEKYRFEELDRETRDYLLFVRDEKGRGAPGLFVGQTDAGPVVAIVLGFAVLIATVIVTFPPTDPPMKEAMLQTAGFLAGGWLVLAAFRIWTASKAGRYAGHFVYADPETLYQAGGAEVEVTDLADVHEAKAVQNFKDGKYQSTNITLRMGDGRKTFTVSQEEGGRRLNVFLNAVAYLRAGGENGQEEALRKLPPETMGAVARIVAKTGEFPSDPARVETDEAVRVPRPRREGRPSSGLLGIAAVGLAGVALFFAFLAMDYPFRDAAVFARIQELPPKDQPPALRMYLQHEKFTAHRDEAQKMLANLYDLSVRGTIQGNDPDMKRGLTEVVLALKDKPTAAVSLRAVQDPGPGGADPQAATRAQAVGTRLADKWSSTIGDELVAFVTLEEADVPANIELRWHATEAGEIEYTMTFRRSPDEEPVVVKTETIPKPAIDPTEALISQVLGRTVGLTRERPPVPIEDF